MFGGKKTSSNSTIDSLIGASARIEGNLKFQGGLRIDGHIVGNVIADESQPSMLIISEQARIDGEVHATHLVVNGLINGPVYARELLELQPKARVVGNVQYTALEMHHGAIVQGTLSHAEDISRPPNLKLAASAPETTAKTGSASGKGN